MRTPFELRGDEFEASVAPEDRPGQAVESGGLLPFRRSGALQVVLVDDSVMVRERLAALLLTETGIEIAGQASDGTAGITLIRELDVDVLVADLDLPPASGIELLQRAKRENASLLAIVLTNYDLPGLRKWCAQRGADFYFHKPTEFEKVLTVCQGLVRARDGGQRSADRSRPPNQTGDEVTPPDDVAERAR